MDITGMGAGTDYAPLYAQVKEILAAGMLAELKDDAKEAMGQGEDNGVMGGDSCPHCGAPMGASVPPMGLGAPAPAPAEPAMPPLDLSQFAMRSPAPPMGLGAGASPMPPMGRRPMPPMPGMGLGR